MKCVIHVLLVRIDKQVCQIQYPISRGIAPRFVTINGKRYAVIEDKGEYIDPKKPRPTDERHIDYKCLRRRVLNSCDQCIRYKEGCLANYLRRKQQ